MLRKKFFAALFFAVLFGAGCSSAQKFAKTAKVQSLKDAYKNYFLIGTALNAQQFLEKDSAADRIIKQQFNAATPENVMKAQILHPGWNRYNFDMADKFVAFCNKNNIKVNAHNLIWHSQLPSFIRNSTSADSVKMFFENHIATVASRYDGKVYSWDVVNEALNEDGTMRNSVYLQKMGPDYVVEAFRLAQKAAPNTLLYYNDYNIESPKKRAGALEIVKKIQAAGVKIDGIGIQGHWHLGTVPYKNIEESIEAFGKLGIKVMFTELDISVLPNPLRGNVADVGARADENGANRGNPYVNGIPDSVQTALAKDYGQLFQLFLKYKDVVSRVTFWGVDDGSSWLNDFPVRGRTNYPLLFDRKHQPKPAFYSVYNLGK